MKKRKEREKVIYIIQNYTTFSEREGSWFLEIILLKEKTTIIKTLT